MKLIDLLQTGIFADNERFKIYDKNIKYLFMMNAKKMLSFLTPEILNTEIIRISSDRDYDFTLLRVILNLECNLQGGMADES